MLDRRARCLCSVIAVATIFAVAPPLSAATSQAREEPPAVDPLAAARSVVYQCGAGNDTGRALGITVDVSTTLRDLVAVSGSFDAGYFSFVRAAMFRTIRAKDREKAYESYVDCVKAIAAADVNRFDAELEKLQGQIAERLEQLATQTLDLSSLVTNGVERHAESDRILLQQLDGLKVQLLDLQKRAKVDPGAVRGEMAETALLAATRTSLSAEDYPSAYSRFEQAMLNRQAPPTADLLSLKARILYGLQRYADAAKVSQQALNSKDPRPAHTQLDDKRLLSDALTRVGRGAQLQQAVDLGIEVSQGDLAESPPNIGGAFAAVASAAQASMRSNYGDEAILKLAGQIDAKADTYSGDAKQLLYYSEALARFQLNRFIRLRNQVEFSATTSRIATWRRRLDQVHAGASERANAAVLEGQLFRWTVQIDDSWASQGFESLGNELTAAAEFYANSGDAVNTAAAEYALALLQNHLKKYAECISGLREASMYVPASSALAADVSALSAVCSDLAGMPGGKAMRDQACRLAGKIAETRERNDRVSKYCGDAK